MLYTRPKYRLLCLGSINFWYSNSGFEFSSDQTLVFLLGQTCKMRTCRLRRIACLSAMKYVGM